jgi:hypothetical protein
MKVGKVTHGIVDFIRDGLGLTVTGVLTQSPLGEIGAVIGYFLGPAIASTSTGKDFNKMFAVLCFFDRFLERFTPKGII